MHIQNLKSGIRSPVRVEHADDLAIDNYFIQLSLTYNRAGAGIYNG